MDIDFLRSFLLCCTAINYLIIVIWFLVFVFARGWLKRMHCRWFNLSDAQFDGIHYAGMAVYKIGILLFNLTPLIVLSLCR
ncbi:MAG: hypothetical protein LBE75_06855 [Burkholderiales bacterium]|jgi:hypothetical protein|nr:hypothetical protein [Burkholderiales bacterium]